MRLIIYLARIGFRCAIEVGFSDGNVAASSRRHTRLVGEETKVLSSLEVALQGIQSKSRRQEQR